MKNIINKMAIAIMSFAICLCVGIGYGISIETKNAKADESVVEMQVETLNSELYQFDDNSGYLFGTTQQTSTCANGMNKLGQLTVKGEKITISTYNGVQAIGLDKGVSLEFTYKQNLQAKNYDGKTWNLSSDTFSSIAGYELGGQISSGAVIVLKSTDGVTWTSLGAKMCNINGSTFTFIPEGSDVGAGTYYSFLSVAEIYHTYVSGSHKEYPSGWCKFWGCHGYWVDDYANAYVNLGQKTTVYVCWNQPEVKFSSQKTEQTVLENDSLADEEINFISKGLTLTNSAVSFSTITVDTLGKGCLSVEYTFNDEPKGKVKTGECFSSPGKYVFTVRTPLEKELVTTLYIVDPMTDNAYQQYFGNGIITEEFRMYNNTKAVPVYMIGKDWVISPNSKWLPGLYGSLYYYEDENSLENEESKIIYEFFGQTEKVEGKFDREGFYIFNLYSSNPESVSGELVNYRFALYIWDNPGYQPTVNYDLLTSTTRNDLFARKVWAVALPTAGGGNFVYCFPYTASYYDLALSVAEQIELLSIETETDAQGGTVYYYKSKNSNTKERYLSKTKLYEAVAEFASANVGELYLESDTDYLTKTAEEDVLKDLTKQSISKDVCVVINESVKKDLQSNEIYVNDFAFVSPADFESSVVMCVDQAGNQHYIPYDVSLNELFDSTQRLIITEVNWNSNRVYEVIYYQEGDNAATLSLQIDNEIVNATSSLEISGNNVSIVEGMDEYDSQSILSILDEDGNREVMLLSESAGYSFSKGEYTLKITNRFAVSIELNLMVYNDETQQGILSGENTNPEKVSKEETGNVEGDAPTSGQINQQQTGLNNADYLATNQNKVQGVNAVNEKVGYKIAKVAVIVLAILAGMGGTIAIVVKKRKS